VTIIKTNQKTKSILLLPFIAFGGLLFAEDNIIFFNEKFAFNIYGQYSLLGFTQEQSEQYTSERPWDIGFGLRYKNISGSVFFPISFDNNSFDIQIDSYYEKMYYGVFFKRYSEFYNENKSINIDLDILSSGITAGWIQNNGNHSLGSVYQLDKIQSKSSGSLLYGFGIYYTSIHTDDELITNYKLRQHFIYFGPTIGYSYTWIFSNSIFFNINLNIGINAGVNTNENRWLFIPQIIPKISLGKHNETWSINFVGGCNYTSIFWDSDNTDNLLAVKITVSFSKRF
jgi:hypothetical protein